ncbi:MAG: LCP family protein [Syntrophomonadaceae bacterium]
MSKAKIYFRIMVAAGILFGFFFALGAGLGEILHRLLPASAENAQSQGFLIEGNRTNILVLGVDARPGQDNVHSRSDTMLLVSLDPGLKKVAIVSIPRDTRVKLNGNTDKINSANVYGGPELATKLVGEIMSIKVDYYVEMDFTGFKNIIDILGGVDINVPQRMYKPSEGIDLQPGQQHLDGSQALGFVRFRDYTYGDIDRTQAQQQFLKALSKGVLQAKTVTRLPSLVNEMHQCIYTNISVSDMLKLATWAPAFNTEGIYSQTLPGTFYEEHDAYGELTASYWVVDQNLAVKVLDALFAGQTLEVVEGSSGPSVSKPQTSTQKPTNTSKSTSKSGTGTNSKSGGGTGSTQDKKSNPNTSTDSNNKANGGQKSTGGQNGTSQTPSGKTSTTQKNIQP